MARWQRPQYLAHRLAVFAFEEQLAQRAEQLLCDLVS